MTQDRDRSSLFFGVIFLLIAGIVGLGGVLWKNFVEYTSNVSSLPEVMEGVSDTAPFIHDNVPQDELVFSFTVPHGDLVKFLEMVQPKLDEIVKGTDQIAVIDIAKSELEVVNRIENDFADFGSISALGYAHFSKERKIRAIFERFSMPPKCSLIIVRKNDAAKTIDDLFGYHIAYKHVYSASGYIEPEKMLKDRGIDSNVFFKQRSFTENFSNSLLGLQNNEFDCAAVSSTFFGEQPKDFQEQFRTIYKSEPIPGGVYIMKSGNHSATEKIVISNFLKFSKNFKGTKAFAGMFRVQRSHVPASKVLNSEQNNEE